MRLVARELRRWRATGVGAQGGEAGDVSQVIHYGGEPNDGRGVLHPAAVRSDERRVSDGTTGRSVRDSGEGARDGNQV
jgi:hypothetical protein